MAHDSDRKRFHEALTDAVETHLPAEFLSHAEEIVTHLEGCIQEKVTVYRVTLPPEPIAELVKVGFDEDSKPRARTKRVSNLAFHYKPKELLGSLSSAEQTGSLAGTLGAPLIPEPTITAIVACLLAAAGVYKANALSDVELTLTEARIVILLWETDRSGKPITRGNISDKLTERFSVGVSDHRIDEALTHLLQIKCIMEDPDQDHRLLSLETVVIEL